MNDRRVHLRLNHSAYLTGLGGLVAAAVLFGGWLPRAACFLWIGLGLADLLWAAATLRSVEVRLEPREEVVDAGRPLTVEIVARARNRLPTVPIVLRDGPACPFPLIRAPQGEVLIGIRGAPGGPLPRSLPARRGRYRLGPLRVIATGPFGVGRAWREVRSQREVLVLPRAWPLPSWAVAPQGRQSGRSAAGYGEPDPVAVAGVRALLPGDRPRHIHWNRSAATGTWQVKNLDRPTAAAMHVLLDLQAAAYDRPGGAELCDVAVEVAASLAGAALAGGQAVTLHGTGARRLELPLPPGRATLQRLMAALAEVRADGARPLAEHFGLAAARLFLVTPAPARAWGPALAGRLRDGLQTSAVQLLGPGDDHAAAARSCAELRRMGIAAWCATGAADLARQLRERGA